MSGHAKLSPSAASRWMTCTKAPSLEEGIPQQPSEYAREGTEAHALAELKARSAVGLEIDVSYEKQRKLPGGLFDEPDPDPEMYEAAEIYAAYIKETYLAAKEACPDVMIGTEVRLDLTEWIPEGFGTADCLIVADGTLHVIDFKYGKGVLVEAEGNKQMMIYALGALDWAGMIFDVDTVKMTIIQPRLNGISTAEMAAYELKQWGDCELAPIAALAYNGGGEYKPSEDACRFCRANGKCQAQADHFVSLFDENEEDGRLGTAEAGEILKRAAGMKDWLTRIEETVKDACLAGNEIPGWKIVEGRTRRQYTDEAEIEKRLRAKKYKVSEIYEKKLLGISKMEKLLGKKKMAEIIGDLIEKPQGSPTLVPESDKRPAWAPEEETLQAFDEE